MRAKPRLTDAVLIALGLLALPAKTTGCGHTACITVTAAQIAQSGGMCPSANAAMARFMDPNCPDTDITAVDGPGVLDGELCCYPVEQNTSGPQVFCGFDTTGVGGGFGVGQGGSSNLVATGVGGCGGCGCSGGGCGTVGGGSGFGGASTVTGDFDAGCASCNAWLSGASASSLCPSAQALEQEVVLCACQGEAGFGCVPGGACSPDDLCQGASPSSS